MTKKTATEFFADLFARSETDPSYITVGMQIDVAEQVYRMMKARGMKQKALAKEMGVTKQRVSKILAGTENLTLDTLARLAAALGCRVEVHYVERPEPPPDTISP